MTSRHDDLALRQTFEQVGPVAHLSELTAAGLPAQMVGRAERQGHLARIGKAVFARRAELQSAGNWGRFRLRSIAYALSASDDVFLTAWSAAALWQIPVISEPPPWPTGLREGSAHRGTDRSAHARVRTGLLPVAHRLHQGRCRVVSPAFAAIEVARRGTRMDALVAVDNVLHRGVGRTELADLLSVLDGYPGISTARWAVEHGDGRAESPLETLGRLSFIEHRLPVPLSNVWVDDGCTAYRADHLDPDKGVVMEGDGGLKYNNRPDASRVVEAQNSRTRWFRHNGYGLERYNFAIARHQRPEIIRRFRQAASGRPAVPVPTNWGLDRPPWL